MNILPVQLFWLVVTFGGFLATCVILGLQVSRARQHWSPDLLRRILLFQPVRWIAVRAFLLFIMGTYGILSVTSPSATAAPEAENPRALYFAWSMIAMALSLLGSTIWDIVDEINELREVRKR